jgi:hypothetical protein
MEAVALSHAGLILINSSAFRARKLRKLARKMADVAVV